MLVDMHAHFPMHLLPGEQRRTHHHVRAYARRRWQARIVNWISRFANYQGPGDTPSVTEALMREGDVGVTLSVLYAPFDEMDLAQRYGRPPLPTYFADILAQLELVEEHARHHPGLAIAHSPGEVDELLGRGLPVLIHAIEGGFQLGSDEAEIRENVRVLAQRGVAYVTIAHLFWRDVATNAPAIPFLPDWLYHLVFPQPEVGLTPLGRAAVGAMVEHGMLVDVSHMSERSISDTFALFDELDPDRRIPLLASHTAYRFGRLEYSVSDETIRGLSQRGGVLGCILCEHYIASGLGTKPRGFDDSVAEVCQHIDRIRELTGSFDHIAIGSDLDGYIKPALPGLEHMGHMRALQQSLADRYGSRDATKICSGNALRILRAAWRGGAGATV